MAFRILCCILLALTCIVPFIAVTALSFFLRKFSFTARVNGPLTLTDVMLRYQVKMNFAIVVRVEKIQLRPSIPYNLFELHVPQPERFLRLHTYGLQINLMVRDDFNKWGSSKIELLTVIDEIRNRLKRLGLLKWTQTEVNGMKNPYEEEQNPAPKQNHAAEEARHDS